jgi:hypothetical protein
MYALEKETDKTSTEGSCLESWLFVVKLFPFYSPFVMLSFLNNRSIVLRACRTSEDPLLFRMPNACLGSMGSGFHTQLRRACSASLHEYNESLSDRPRIVDSQRIMTVVNQTFQGKKNQTLFGTPFDMSRGLCLSRFD